MTRTVAASITAVLLLLCAASPLAARSGQVDLREEPAEHGGLTDEREAAVDYDWPMRPTPQVLRPFEPPPCPYCAGHRGVDLGGSPGQPVHAAAPGVVVYAGDLAGRGVVSLDHGRLRTTYEPVEAVVDAEDAVEAGQEIGRVVAGHGTCSATCLHWGARIGDRYLDPLTLLDIPRLRLKPTV